MRNGVPIDLAASDFCSVHCFSRVYPAALSRFVQFVSEIRESTALVVLPRTVNCGARPLSIMS